MLQADDIIGVEIHIGIVAAARETRHAGMAGKSKNAVTQKAATAFHRGAAGCLFHCVLTFLFAVDDNLAPGAVLHWQSSRYGRGECTVRNQTCMQSYETRWHYVLVTTNGMD
jgi:hypothetical protein